MHPLYTYLVRQTKYKHVTTSRCRRHRRRLDYDVIYWVDEGKKKKKNGAV